MEEPEDDFSSARHSLLEVMAGARGVFPLGRGAHLQSKRGVQASHPHYGNEHDCRGLVRNSLAIQAAFKCSVQGTAFH